MCSDTEDRNRCHAEKNEDAMPISNCQPIRLLQIIDIYSQFHILNDKQCRSRSVGFLFVCLFGVEVLWPSQLIRVRSSMVSLPIHTSSEKA